MRTRALATLVTAFGAIVACGFDGVAGLDVPSDPGDASAAAVDASADVDASPQGPCSDPSLVLCMRFEGSVVDEARAQIVEVTGTPAFEPGVAGTALTLDANLTVHIANGPAWTYSALSFEVWVKPAALPQAGARAGLIDKNNSFGVFLQPNGAVTCTMKGAASAVVAAVGQWVHIACVNDGTTTKLYADGVERASVPAGTVALTPDLAAIGSNSPSGSPFVGALDSLRLFARARTPGEIAAAARR